MPVSYWDTWECDLCGERKSMERGLVPYGWVRVDRSTSLKDRHLILCDACQGAVEESITDQRGKE